MILNYIKKNHKKIEDENSEKLIKVTSLLIHAAKIDDNYSDKEKLIISIIIIEPEGSSKH